jgi:hypothetical protein
MPDFFRKLFSADFMPHVLCLREPAIVALHAKSDGLITSCRDHFAPALERHC